MRLIVLFVIVIAIAIISYIVASYSEEEGKNKMELTFLLLFIFDVLLFVSVFVGLQVNSSNNNVIYIDYVEVPFEVIEYEDTDIDVIEYCNDCDTHIERRTRQVWFLWFYQEDEINVLIIERID